MAACSGTRDNGLTWYPTLLRAIDVCCPCNCTSPEAVEQSNLAPAQPFQPGGQRLGQLCGQLLEQLSPGNTKERCLSIGLSASDRKPFRVGLEHREQLWWRLADRRSTTAILLMPTRWFFKRRKP